MGIVKDVRQARHIKQKDMAEMIGVSSAYLCAIEAGNIMPRLELALKIAEILEIEDIYFFKEMVKDGYKND